MTKTDDTKKQQINRMIELAKLSRQRYLEAGGESRLSVGSLNDNDCLTGTEKQEFRDLFNQVVKDEDIANYLQTKGTWQERFAAIKKRNQQSDRPYI